MKVSEMIKALEDFKAEHGDLEVERNSFVDERVTHEGPELAFRKILSGKERKAKFWTRYGSKGEVNKGDPVCRL